MRTNTNTTNDTQTNLTLREAVVQAVNELKGNGSMSAHDVTNTIRESVNAGEYALPGYEARANTAGGTIKYWVDHEAVKTVIDDLLADGELRNLGLTNVNNTNQPYRVFEFATPTDPVDAATPAPAPTVTNAAAIAAQDTQGVLAQRVKAYLDKQDGAVTLKQVQGALKTTGVTCEDFYNLITALGYDVEPGTEDKYSTYTV